MTMGRYEHVHLFCLVVNRANIYVAFLVHAGHKISTSPIALMEGFACIMSGNLISVMRFFFLPYPDNPVIRRKNRDFDNLSHVLYVLKNFYN